MKEIKAKTFAELRAAVTAPKENQKYIRKFNKNRRVK